MLSPVALAVVLLYSYTKRFTRWSHLVLGFALGIAPAAAWIAVRGSLDPRILILTAAVTFWVGGFDMLYACQDIDFDRANRLNSVPQSFGIPRALILARVLHMPCCVLLVALVVSFGLGKIALCMAWLRLRFLLAYEHSLVSQPRPEQTQRRLLYHERRHCRGVLRLHSRRFTYKALTFFATIVV